MPYRITQCYLPPGRGDIPALTPAEAGTRLSDPGGMQGWVDIVDLLHTEMVYPPEDGHPSMYSNRARRALTSFMRRTPLTTTPRHQPYEMLYSRALKSWHKSAYSTARNQQLKSGWKKRWRGLEMQLHQLDHVQTNCTSLQTDSHTTISSLNLLQAGLVSDVVEKTSTCRRSRILCVVVEKNTTRRREDGGVVVDKKCKKSTSFQ